MPLQNVEKRLQWFYCQKTISVSFGVLSLPED